MTSLDYLIVGLYAVVLIAIATFVSKTKSGEKKTAEEYFLAGRSLPWWAIGTSLIAANIAADQIIGMNGDAYAMGIAIATYEWTAAVALIVVGKFLLPVYLKQQVFTMPQLLSQRYDRSVSTLLAVLMLIMYVMVILSKRCSNNCGIVKTCCFKYTGNKNLPMTINATAAVHSYVAIAMPNA